MPGDSLDDQLGWLLNDLGRRRERLAGVSARVDDFLRLDLASPGIVKMLEGSKGDAYPDMAWEPKAAFTVVAGCYRRSV